MISLQKNFYASLCFVLATLIGGCNTPDAAYAPKSGSSINNSTISASVLQIYVDCNIAANGQVYMLTVSRDLRSEDAKLFANLTLDAQSYYRSELTLNTQKASNWRNKTTQFFGQDIEILIYNDSSSNAPMSGHINITSDSVSLDAELSNCMGVPYLIDGVGAKDIFDTIANSTNSRGMDVYISSLACASSSGEKDLQCTFEIQGGGPFAVEGEDATKLSRHIFDLAPDRFQRRDAVAAKEVGCHEIGINSYAYACLVAL